MSRTLRTLMLVAGIAAAGTAAAQVTFYENDGFHGRSFTADRTVFNFANTGFNDLASSAIVRGGSWEVCTDARFEGRCVVLRPGDYPSLRALGLNDRVSSIRPADRVARNEVAPEPYARPYDRGDRYSDNNRYDYRGDGWRYDRLEHRWERY